MSEGFRSDLCVCQAPFGWYKGFDLSCLGHSLSKWSALYDGDEADVPAETPERAGSEFVRFVIADFEGRPHEVTPEDSAPTNSLAGKDWGMRYERHLCDDNDSVRQHPPHRVRSRTRSG
ncbi:TPA: hypothetical protein DCE37_25645 [Candidatus Latescibacteria bacterium]|nr:hypothetical protein [Candidatus Latescibacterota bacterium]